MKSGICQSCHLCLQGPTSDYENNIQLHSAKVAKCDHFVTNDEQLLKHTEWQLVPVTRSNSIQKAKS